MINIALITYNISPFRGSEYAVSWNFVKKLSPYVKLHIFYGNGHADIQKFLDTDSIPNAKWIHIPTDPIPHGGLRWLIENWFKYKKWHKQLKTTISDYTKSNQIDIIHYLNPIGFKEPGYCWQITGTPYIWGPIKAYDAPPFSLFKALRPSGILDALLRHTLHAGMFYLSPRLKKALNNTDATFATTPDSVCLLKKVHNIEAPYMPENGILEMERTNPISLPVGQTLRLCFIGRPSDQKGTKILLDALRFVKSSNWHLDIIGDHPHRQIYQKQFADLANHISWHGNLPRDTTQTILANAHLHCILSLHESNTTVIWEAMAKAIPTLTLDHCGMAGVVCQNCGIKIPIDSYRKTIRNIADEIQDIIDTPQRIASLSAGVLQCSQKFLWDARIPILLETYKRLSQK